MQSQFINPAKNLFSQLQFMLEKLSAEEYMQKSESLFNATIGEHVRHIIELFVELNKGYESGVVDYEKRNRDYRIQTDKYFAIKRLDEILKELNKADKSLQLITDYSAFGSEIIIVNTNYNREVIYNLEHTVHHMALIRVGISEISSIEIPTGFGVAASTIKFKQTQCAQ